MQFTFSERRLYDKKMIKNKKDNKILKRVLSLCLVLMLAVTSVHLFFPVGAETIDHTHIWATTYDSWEAVNFDNHIMLLFVILTD